jgi:bacterial/archaeal transporter family-2 protein
MKTLTNRSPFLAIVTVAAKDSRFGPRTPDDARLRLRGPTARVIRAAVSATSLAVVLSLVAGLAGSIQVAVSGAFGKRIGVLEATAFGSITAALIVCAVLLVARQSVGGVGEGLRAPPWLWLGGAMGAIVVTTITFTAPRIGTFATIGLLIAGQLAMGVVIDAFGLFGTERIPVTAARVAGLALLAAGAVLVLKR